MKKKKQNQKHFKLIDKDFNKIISNIYDLRNKKIFNKKITNTSIKDKKI